MNAVGERGKVPPPRRSWAARGAGGLMILLGVANAAFGVLALTTDLVRLAAATAGSLLVLGVVTVGGGVLVSRGSRAAVTVALTVFGLLLIAQLGDVLPGGEQGAAARLAVLGVLVAALAAAMIDLRPTGRAQV